MQKHILRAALLLSLLLVFAKPLLASNVTLIMPGQNDTTAPAQLSPDQYPPQPALFKFTNGNATVYLFGTMENIVKGTKWRTNQLNRVLAHVDRMWFSTTPRTLKDQMLTNDVLEILENKDGKRIENLLSREEMAKLRKVSHEHNFDIDEFARYHPWYIAQLLERQRYKNRIQKDPNQEIEYAINVVGLIDVLNLGKPILPLMNIREYVLGISQLSDEDDKAILINKINKMDEEEMPAFVLAWSKGDLKAISKRVEESKEDTPGLYKQMLVERNKILFNKIASLMRGSGTEFVGVYVDELVGPNGLINLMEQAGYKAERIYDTEPPVATDTERKTKLRYVFGPGDPLPLVISLTNGKKPDEVLLHIFQEKTYNGCVQLSPLKMKTVKNEEAIDINILGYLISIPPYTKGNDCGPPVKTVEGDVVLNVSELKKHKTHTLKLTSPHSYALFTLTYEDGILTIMPRKDQFSELFVLDPEKMTLTGL